MSVNETAEMTPLQGVAAMGDGVRENVLALQALQEDYQELFLKFCKEKDQLEAKYEDMYQPLYNRRKEIVTGTKDASEEEIKKGEELAKKEEEDESKVEEVNDEGEVEEKEEAPKIADTDKGIPDFWLTSMMREDLSCASIIEEHDKPILKHLLDVSCKVTTEPAGFILTFEFEDNEHFKNKTLTKTYVTKLDEKDGEQLLFKATGCDIEWNDGKDVTKKVVKKKQSSKSGKGTRVVEKQVANKSFFGFFDPPFAEDEDLTEEIADKMEEDFLIGTEIKESLVPRAVAWYTGAALVSGFEDFDGDDDDDDDDDEEEGGAPAQGDCKQQ
eukprot:TRINITY_DN3350_c0_g2_i1.p2 TRINITY_DN3350_c0_g2~~TRINITY_DN3350_c0_g2_i1.p2  ORF type:complete len:328 (+),score=164.68 TRINITY_DN3350_c0_g2_i1:221-1204(+)